MRNPDTNSIWGSFLFDGIPPSDMETLKTAFALQKQVYDNEATVECPRSTKGLVFVLRGAVRVLFRHGERAVPVNTITAGGCFGAAELFQTNDTDRKRSPNGNGTRASGGAAGRSKLIAVGETEVIILTEDQLLSLFIKFPVTSVNYIRFLSDRIRFLNSRISFLSAGSAEKKLAGYLLSNPYPNGGTSPTLNMKETAATLGMGRATFYRALDALQDIGAIHREDGAIHILDATLLKAFINADV